VDRRPVDAKIDTGADLCGVPHSLVDELDLRPFRGVRAAGINGVMGEVPVYRIEIHLDDMRFADVEALSTRRAYLIVGRNVLQHLVFRYDGPRGVIEIRDPRAKPR
jgi:predicted aspartyl protease